MAMQSKKIGSPGRTRTIDKVINSHLLYQLSYRGILNFDATLLQGAKSRDLSDWGQALRKIDSLFIASFSVSISVA